MKTNILTTVISILLLLSIQISFAQSSFDKEKLDNYFNALEKNNKFMGSVAVSKNGKIIYERTIGLADVENKIKATNLSKYRIGSISKTFTAALILKAHEEQRLDLTQTIDKWFPTIKNSEIITVQNLLNHRSGIHNFTSNQEYLTWHTLPKTEKEMIEIITKGGSDFSPGSKAQYSNSNYVLLTYILEKTFNKSFSQLLKEYITDPIGLTNTYVFGKTNVNNLECRSYKFTTSWTLEPETDYTIPLGAGAIISTASDVTKFADALFGGKIINNESLQIMKNIVDGYGSGIFQIPFYNSIGFGHTGGIDGFSSVFSHFPDQNISYALVCNGTNFDNNQISIAVLSALYNKPYEIPQFSTLNLTSQELDQYLGVYSSNQISLKITITKDGNTLTAQGTGQPSFPLEAIEKDKFKFDKAGIKLQFNPLEKTMILYQGGAQINFTKEL